MKTSEHVKLLLYHSTRNSGPDENIRTCEVITISQYKKFRPDENIRICEVTTIYITVQQEIIFV